MKINRRIKIVLGLAVSFLSAVALAFVVDWSEFGRSLARVNYWFLIPATACMLASYFCRALQWRYVLGKQRPVGVFAIFRITMIGWLVNIVLPARLGEVARAYVLARKYNYSKGTAFATVIVTRLLDGAMLFLLFALFTILIPAKVAGLKAGGTTGFVIYLVIVGFFVLFYFKRDMATVLVKSVVGRFSRAGAAWLIRVLNKFMQGFSCFRKPADLGRAFGYTAAVWGFVALSFHFVILAFKFSAPLPLYAGLLLVPIVSLAVALPSSPGFIGTMELGVIAALQIIKPALTRHEELSYAVIVHAVQIIPAVALGLYFLWVEHLKITDLAKVEEEGNGPGCGKEARDL